MATIQVPYGIRLPEDENLKNTNRVLRGVAGGIETVTGAYRAQKEQAAKAIQGHDEREFAQRLAGVGGVTPSESRFVPSVNAGVQPTEATRFAQNQPKANWWDKSQLDKEVPVAQQTAKPKTYREMYATPYDALNQMPDAKFKELVDTHKVPGLGYTESQGGMIRIMPEQQNPQAPREKVSAIGLQALADYQRAMTGERQAATGEAGLGMEGRRADIESRKADIDAKKLEHEIASTDMKDPLKKAEMYQKLAVAFGGEQYEVDELGQRIGKSTTPNYDAADDIFKSMNIPVPERKKAKVKVPISNRPSLESFKKKK